MNINPQKPLISVIIPAYNAASYIVATLDSIIAQTYTNFEVIVVDDGSQDETPNIVESFHQKDPRIRLIRQQNGGVARARNLAIQHSKGDFIAPIDADDIWYPKNLEKQVSIMSQEDHRVGLVYSWSVFIDEKGQLENICQTSQLEGYVYFPLLYSNFPGNASSVLIRRSCLERVGGYEPHYRDCQAQGCEDWDLYLRIAQFYEFRVVQELLIGYRQVTQSMSSNHKSMTKGFSMFMESVKRKDPKIPAFLYQWTASNFNWYTAQKCSRVGDHPNAIAYWFKAGKTDYLPWIRYDFYIFFLKSILKLLCQPVTSLVWTDHSAWVKFKKDCRSKLNLSQKRTLASLNLKQYKNIDRFPWKQYRLFLQKRFEKIEKIHKLSDS